MTEENNNLNDAVKDGGAYDIIKKRLNTQGEELQQKIEKLNQTRKDEFGGTKNEIIGKTNIRTDNNCTPVDVAQINNHLLLGYNVSVGMKTEIKIDDVLGFYEIEEIENGYRTNKIPFEDTFLNDDKFKRSFNDLMTYYKGSKLVQIIKNLNNLLVFFQIGKEVHDLKIFRFNIDKNNEITYLDDKGLDNYHKPNYFDFDWISTSRKDHVIGKHPHISINDQLFVETVGGDLTIKIENNTDDGLGIYREPVDDLNQGLEESDIFFSETKSFIFLKIKPYRENNFRYFIYNKVTEDIIRADAIGNSCKILPEEHGVIFSNGYYLVNGDKKFFNKEAQNLKFFDKISSPNGEDFLYVFFDAEEGAYVLYSYNIITKELQNPIPAHGYSLYENGLMVIFKEDENSEAKKIHPLRLWQTPFCSDIFFNQQLKNSGNSFLSNIGNAELVRAISDVYSIVQYINKKEVSNSLFEGVIKQSNKCLDDYHWLTNEQAFVISTIVEEIISTSELVIDEFEKVKSIQENAEKEIEETSKHQHDLINSIKLADPKNTSGFVQLLDKIKGQLGHLISIREQRYIDVDKVDAFKNEIENQKDIVNQKLINLLQNKKSFDEYFNRILKAEKQMNNAKKVVDLEPAEIIISEVTADINIINDEVSDIKVKDATITAQILDHVSEVYAKVNQIKARIKNVKKSFLTDEAKAEFASQFKLLSQSVSSALTSSETPDKCDEQMARLMSQVESLESKFADFDEYLTEIYTKREEIQTAFESHKEQLLNAVQRRVNNIEKAATITLNSINKKVEKFDDIDALNSYFASDSMVLKLIGLIEEVKNLGDSVKSDDLDSKLKSIKDKALRSLRDNKDIFEDNGRIMKMGKHKFSVNKNNVDLTVVPKNDGLSFHLTSTDFYEDILNEEFNSLKEYWNLEVISETKDVYRAEYLAYSVLKEAEDQVNGLNMQTLQQAITEDKLESIVQKYSATKYKEGYIKGVHDADATLILETILKMYDNAGELKFSQKNRAATLVYMLTEFLSNIDSTKKHWELIRNIEWKNAMFLYENFNDQKEVNRFIENHSVNISNKIKKLDYSPKKSAEYFGHIVSKSFNETKKSYDIQITRNANDCSEDFLTMVRSKNITLFDQKTNIEDKFKILKTWIQAYVNKKNKEEWKHFVDEAAAVSLIKTTLEAKQHFGFLSNEVSLSQEVEGLIGQHKNLESGKLFITLDDFLERCEYQQKTVVPNYEKVQNLKKMIINDKRDEIQIKDFTANPLSSFVRNKLITESYLHLIGDNFAKQMGTIGENKRTDSNGMLLLISPPGYGKTTLIEYVADKLGLVFMKINCPSLSHDITSLDPAEAPDATSRKELEKLNLSFEMGNNVLLYLDDIQHTSPEFLQKFISLCDGTRRIDGVWKGKPKTYDMKGKKFSIVMAGNPYTESGEVFKIPDMLANRADIYNLGEMLSGQAGIFELSYIENSLTSNQVLAPLATRDLDDLYRFIDMAKGEKIPLNDFDHNYSTAEANEIVTLLKKSLKVQDVVLKVNKEYIKSASIADKYRTEPSFKLQGSYRNMNKMVEKVVSVMNDKEVDNVILDHYVGEAQTLSNGTEENLLKLKEVLEIMTDEEKERWEGIKKDFTRHKMVGDEDTDGSVKIANQLVSLNERMSQNQPWQEHLLKIADNLTDEKGEIQSFNHHLEALMTRIKKIEATEVKDEFVIEALKNLNHYLEVRVKRHKEALKSNAKDNNED
jgi:hypothetical protein